MADVAAPSKWKQCARAEIARRLPSWTFEFAGMVKEWWTKDRLNEVLFLSMIEAQPRNSHLWSPLKSTLESDRGKAIPGNDNHEREPCR